jgi:hypothetical protein
VEAKEVKWRAKERSNRIIEGEGKGFIRKGE